MRFLFPLGKQQQTGIQFTFATFQLSRCSPVCPELGLSKVHFLIEYSKKETSEIVLFILGSDFYYFSSENRFLFFFLFFHHPFPSCPHLSEVLVPDLFKLFWKDRTHSNPGVEWKGRLEIDQFYARGLGDLFSVSWSMKSLFNPLF